MKAARRGGIAWYRASARLLAAAILALFLWACAIASPFILAHVLALRGTAARAWTLAAVAAAAMGVVSFLCRLMDRL